MLGGRIVRSPSSSPLRIVKDFNAWLGELPYKHKIVIAGNNELGFNDLSKEESRNVLSNATYLQDEAVTIMGPTRPPFLHWFLPQPLGSLPHNSALQSEDRVVLRRPIAL